MKKLTKAEEEIMQIIWRLGRCTVTDILNELGDPKPPRSSISSIVQILEKERKFLGYKAYGRTYEYFPIVSKDEYSKFSLKKIVNNYFEGSMNNLVSFLVKENDLDVKALGELLDKLSDEDETKS
ncbi:MAG: BlaI/MecI/CopY family transcriptional regulator [Bacteroidota bacterium]